MPTIVNCAECGSPMAWYPDGPRPKSLDGIRERGSRELCKTHWRRLKRGIGPRPPRFTGAKMSFDELLDCIGMGMHPDDIARRYDYVSRESVYRRLERAGFDEEKAVLMRRAKAAPWRRSYEREGAKR